MSALNQAQSPTIALAGPMISSPWRIFLYWWWRPICFVCASHVSSTCGLRRPASRSRWKTKSCQTYYVPLFIYILAKRLICKCFWVLRFEFRVLPRLFCPVRLIPLFGFNLTAWVGIVTHVHCASQRVLAARQAGIFCGIGYQYNMGRSRKKITGLFGNCKLSIFLCAKFILKC